MTHPPLKILLPALVLLLSPMLYGAHGPRKTATVRRMSGIVRIDGRADEPDWADAQVCEGFTQYEPANGYPTSFETKVRMLFDDEGVYVFADMIDAHPDSISRELGKRDSDNEINADWFSVDLCPFDDGVNGFSFKLTVTGVQTDIRRGSGSTGRDVTWDAVWDSGTRITGTGWSSEIFIPFSSIRFPVSGNSQWGVNFHRFVARRKEVSSWNFTDKKKGNTISQTGVVTGFGNIDPPVRLSLMPYFSAYFEGGEAGARIMKPQVNGGMDLKWGINESFTVDATLIPDFSQVQADDQVLNLTPYEIQYNERRQFFTEGTDVFSKADIFYSRRIGAKPRFYNDAMRKADQEGLTVVSNPLETTMINATKLSGRTGSGLGIGFFNAMTGRSAAILSDPVTGEKVEFTTESFTNYNMVVLDQSLPNASYVSLVNTNVMRSGPDTGRNYTANVTATDMQFNTADKMFSAQAVGAVSQKYFSGNRPETGHSLYLSGGKTGGRYTARYEMQVISDDYDPNDMGYLRRNNLFSNEISFGYNLYTPMGLFYSSKNSLSLSYDRLYKPSAFNDLNISLVSSSVLTNFWTVVFTGSVSPSGSDDYFEPRAEGMMYHRQPAAVFTAEIGTDPRKVFMMEVEAGYTSHYLEPGRFSTGIEVNPSVRFSNRFSGKADFNWELDKKDEGYAGMAGDEIIFGQRDNRTLSCEMDLSYMFSAHSYISFRMREYWARAAYTGNYFRLNVDGSLTPVNASRSDNTSYNAFNADINYTWRFAPGSELTLMLKNALYDSEDIIPATFGDNLKGLWAHNITRSLSCKVIWYLDYHTVTTRWFARVDAKDRQQGIGE